jgi:hypothetical protein
MSAEIEIEVTTAPAVLEVELATGAPGLKGDKGDQGEQGSDASVTSSNIAFALGYTPDAPTAPRTPTAHTHAVADVTGLQSALDGKQAAGSYATAAQGAKADTALQPGTAISSVSGLQTALDGKQPTGDYATLVGGTVPASQLPSYVDDVLEFATLAAFPATGETGKIYVATGSNKTYRWSGSSYVEMTSSPGSTDAVPEGATNLYFTAARAVSALASTLASYATQAWVTAQGFATTSSVSSAISALVTGVSSVAGKTGAVTLVKGDVGLGNVDNTSDLAKPISTATQTALDGKQAAGSYASASHTHNRSQITDFPTLGTSSAFDVAASGNASATQVVRGNDTRLTDARTPTAHTHSAAAITSGTLSIDRLDPLVSLDNVNNNFSVNQTFAGTNNTAPNQTAASGSSLMTRDLGDARYPLRSITAAPTATYSSNGGQNITWLTELWQIPAGFFGFNQNNFLMGNFARGKYVIRGNSPSLRIAPYTGYTVQNINQCAGTFIDPGVFVSTFSSSSNAVDLLANAVFSRFRLYNSGIPSRGLRYRFSANFAANAGDVIVMSPSGHTFIVDIPITDATVFTNTTTGGVFVQAITSSGTPSASDTSLTVNGGAAISTTFAANSASNTSTMPEGILFPSSTGWHIWNRVLGAAGEFSIYYMQ